MILLAIDTSSNLCAAAIYDCSSDRLLAAKSENIGRGHAERLMGLLGEVLEEAGIAYRDVGKIVATSGPGSFTGIRVGLATARGLALGLGIEAIGVNVLEVIAYQHNVSKTHKPIVVAMDAKRGEVFMQVFSAKGMHLTKPVAVPVDLIGQYLPDQPFRIAGSASSIITNMISAIPSCQKFKVCSNQSAADIGIISKFAATLIDVSEKPVPLYLRSADAKPQQNFALKRVAN